MICFILLIGFFVSCDACDDLNVCCLSNDRENKVVSVEHCPEGWVRFKDSKCFKLFTDSRTHQKAEKACSGHGSTLASIHSDEERLFLVSYLMREVPVDQLKPFWIGLQNKETLWYWSDLSQFSFANWWPGHPDLTGTGPCGLVITRFGFFKTNSGDFGKMGVDKCSMVYPYMCQKFQVDTRRCNLQEFDLKE